VSGTAIPPVVIRPSVGRCTGPDRQPLACPLKMYRRGRTSCGVQELATTPSRSVMTITTRGAESGRPALGGPPMPSPAAALNGADRGVNSAVEDGELYYVPAMSPGVEAALIAGGVGVVTLIGTLVAQFYGINRTSKDNEKTRTQQTEQLDTTLTEQREQLA